MGGVGQVQVDAADDGEIAVTGGQAAAGQVQRDQGRRAGGVHGERGPLQVEKVRDPGGGEVAERAGESVGLIAVGLVEQLGVGALADRGEDPDPESAAAGARVAGAFEGLVGQLQEDPRVRVEIAGLVAVDPEVPGVEQGRVVEERPAVAGDAVLPRQEVRPEALRGVRVREAAGHADDRDVRTDRRPRGLRDRGGLRPEEAGGQRGDGGAVAEIRRVELVTDDVLQLGQDLHGRQGGAADREEPVVRADPVRRQPQDPGPGRTHGTLGFHTGGPWPYRRSRRGGLPERPVVAGDMDHRGVRGEEAVTQQVAAQLSAGRAGESAPRQDLDADRVVAERLGDPGAGQLGGVRRRADRGRGEEEHDALAPGGRIGGADHRDRPVAEPRSRRRDVLQIGRVEVTAVDEEDVLRPAGDAEPPAPEEARVAGPQPAVHQRLRGRLRIVVVAARHVRPAHLDVPDQVLLQRLAGVVDDPDHAARHGRAEVHQLGPALGRLQGDAAGEGGPAQTDRAGDLRQRRDGHRQRGLGQPVDRLQRARIEPRARHLVREGSPHRRRDRLRAHHHQPDRGEIQIVPVADPAHDHREGEVRRGQHGGAVLVGGPQPELRPFRERHRADPHLAAPRVERAQMRADQAHVVEVRHPGQHHVVRTEPGRLGGLREVRHQVRVGEPDPLGRAGAARRELQERDVVRGHRHRPGQRRGGPQAARVPGDHRRPEMTGDRGDPRLLRRQRHRDDPGHDRAPEERKEVVLRGDDQMVTLSEAGRAEPAADPERVRVELGVADPAVAIDEHHLLRGRMGGGPDEYVGQRHRRTLSVPLNP